MNKDDYTQLRIWRTTLQKLRRIYAETGETMIAIVDRLADEELKTIKREDAFVFEPIESDGDFAPVWPESDWPQNETDGTTIWPSPKRS